jgi:hypothetical protein
MAGAMRLVMRRVADTLTLVIVVNTSGDVLTKSVGKSCDTPTLLTIHTRSTGASYSGRER